MKNYAILILMLTGVALVATGIGQLIASWMGVAEPIHPELFGFVSFVAGNLAVALGIRVSEGER